MQITTWNFRRIMLACPVAGLLAATAISFAVPVHYQSHVTLMVMPACESGNLLVNKAAKTALSPESLASIIRENNLYPRERATMSLDDVIGKMQSKVRVVPLSAGSSGNRDALAFSIQFDYPDPSVAQQVDSELTARFMESHARMLALLLDSRSTFRVLDPPTLPHVPAGPNRTQFAAVGLFTGILVGLAVAITSRARRTTAVRNA